MDSGRWRYACYDEDLQPRLKGLIALVQAYADGRGLNNQSWEISPIYQGRNQLYRLRERREGGYDLVIKCFAVPNPLRQIYYGWTDSSKAKRSFLNSFQLEQLGIGVARARAFVEEFNAFRGLKRSYYLSDFIEAKAYHIHNEMRGWSAPEGFLPALAEFLLQLHEEGVEHRDLSPGNILYQYDELGQGYSFSLVDVNRMQFYPFPLSVQLSLKNLERLASHYSVSSQLAFYYAQARGLEPKPFTTELNRICDNFWLNRLPKLAVRKVSQYYAIPKSQATKLYLRYKWLRLRRKLSRRPEQKARLFAEEESLYQKYISLEDIRHSLLRREGYGYHLDRGNTNNKFL